MLDLCCDGAAVRRSGPCIAAGADGRPLVYPEPVYVRNTFIDVPLPRTDSSDEILLPIRSHSCPEGVLSEQALDACTPVDVVDSAPEAASDCSTVDTSASSASPSPRQRFSGCPPAACAGPWRACDAARAHAHRDARPTQRRHEEVRPGPQRVSLQKLIVGCRNHTESAADARAVELEPCGLPSVGSAGHRAGTCSPCAFLYTRGCDRGTECEFCHLCGPEVRKQRKKEKRAYFTALKRAKRRMPADDQAPVSEEAEVEA